MTDTIQKPKEYTIRIHKADGAIITKTVKCFAEVQKSINSDYLEKIPVYHETSWFFVDEQLLFKNLPTVPEINISEVAQTLLSEHCCFGDVLEIGIDDMEAMPYDLENDE